MTHLEQILGRPGETARIARELGIKSQAVSQWRRSGCVPPNRVIDVERITGVHRHFLNPTVYPEPPKSEAA
jgi:DNA-binding transcriptional regulator YdaS (Cro superfamily)